MTHSAGDAELTLLARYGTPTKKQMNASCGIDPATDLELRPMSPKRTLIPTTN